ncbi:MAG: hypothetical protein AB8H79_09765 [Myxococcota bacterium]
MRILLPIAMLACGGPDAPAPSTLTVSEQPMTSAPATPAETPKVHPREAQQAYWVKRTDAELDSAFEQVCAESKADGKPVLIAFSAEWCIDCKRVYSLSKAEPLREELAQWHTLVVNPGQFDRHVPVLGAFGVSRLVTWVATQPQDCRLPAPAWTRLRQGAFEPASGQPWSGEQLTAWLQEARSTTEVQP